MRLALLLAALVVSGPMPSIRVVDAARLDVSIAWFRGERAVTPSAQQSSEAIASAAETRSGFNAHPTPHLPLSLLSYSQFQRPPPLSH